VKRCFEKAASRLHLSRPQCIKPSKTSRAAGRPAQR
jgi:hypothetical protein